MVAVKARQQLVADADGDLGVAAVFTPKDFGLNDIMAAVVAEIRLAHRLEVTPVPA